MPRDERKEIGIVTGSAAPELTDDGRALASALRERGFAVEPVVWDDPSATWDRYDCLVVRSCWEYDAAVAQFRNWLDAVEASDVHVFNAPDVLRWNVHKSYLRDLEQAGVPVTPTEFVDRGSNADLEAILERTGWTDVVVKPAVGTSSDGVWRARTPIEPAAVSRFRDQRAETDLLVQQFVPEIARGERSFVFFGGEFSHAYRCVPAADDFRAHPEYGGSVEPDDPPRRLVEQAETALATAGSACSRDASEFVYARVDGVERSGGFELMELEVIEPYLGLATSERGVERFADAIVAALRRRTTTSSTGTTTSSTGTTNSSTEVS